MINYSKRCFFKTKMQIKVHLCLIASNEVTYKNEVHTLKEIYSQSITMGINSERYDASNVDVLVTM
jgi:hypothetical protein